jgi:hypothetical protein
MRLRVGPVDVSARGAAAVESPLGVTFGTAVNDAVFVAEDASVAVGDELAAVLALAR